MTNINRIVKKDGRIIKTQIDAPKPVYNVRIKPEFYEPLVGIASANSRSVTNQINYILEQFLQKQK